MKSSRDLTVGSIGKTLLLYFLPIAAGTIFQQLYSAVDAVVVGKFVGTRALAAVGGSAANIINLLIGFFTAMSGGAAVVVAHLFGAKEDDLLPSSTGTAFAFCLAAGTFLTVIGLLFSRQFLLWMKCPEETLEDAALYLRIYFCGTVFLLLFNMESGILRAVGDSRTPFLYLMFSALCNIILDLVFVIVFHLDVAGVAFATVISQFLSCLLVTVRLLRTSQPYQLQWKNVGFHPQLIRRMMLIGIPTGLQSSMFGFSNLVLQIGVNLLGTTVVASWSLSGKIDGFYWATINAAGIAIMNFVGQNYGAGRMDRVKECRKTGLKLFSVVTIAFSALILSVGRSVLPVFTDDSAVVDTTFTIICYFVPGYFLWTYIEVSSGVLRGVGDSAGPTVITGLGICLLRIIWVVTLFHSIPTLFCLSMSYPVSWIVTDLAFFFYLRKVALPKLQSTSEH